MPIFVMLEYKAWHLQLTELETRAFGWYQGLTTML